ncbi:MAG: hypothetical protein J2P21_10660 [Chloracidobacterium sp.]|nr:hypothetical protein [Chloracidobacterium sp.]
MTESLRAAATSVFHYSSAPPSRRHGPRGYLDYVSFKAWLRDEFAFRCVYCLTRELWCPAGHEDFSVEHFIAQVTDPQLRGAYDNLFYVCCACNAARRDVWLPLDPAREPLGAHWRIARDGVAKSLTAEGAQFIEICRLNRSALVDFRRRVAQAKDVLRDLLAFPADLPDLAALRPPEGNARPEGIAECCFERRRRGELPEVY